jgi:SLOG cluster3 family
VVRERELVFGGHPAISPLVEHAARSLGALDRVHIYQSEFFKDKIPEVAREFANLHWTKAKGSGGDALPASLTHMRLEMIGSRNFCAAVFIGGMEGLFEELELFKQRFPDAVTIPVASTGGAAKDILERGEGPQDVVLIEALREENRYRRLFTELLPKD